MYFLSAILLGLASSALASPTKRAEAIKVDVAGPTGVNSISDLKITAKVTNTGSEAVKLLKYGTILDEKLPTKSFKVTKDGQVVPFTGVKVGSFHSFIDFSQMLSMQCNLQLSVDLTQVDEAAFATIPAGETITVQHDVASLYDFASVGAGKFSFEPITTFQMHGVEDSVDAQRVGFAKVTTASSKYEVEVTGDLAKRELTLNKRARDICTDSSKKSFIDAR
jgi:deuterolysin